MQCPRTARPVHVADRGGGEGPDGNLAAYFYGGRERPLLPPPYHDEAKWAEQELVFSCDPTAWHLHDTASEPCRPSLATSSWAVSP